MNASMPQAYPLSKVASILKVSKPLVLKMAKSGELPCDRTPLGIRVDAGKLGLWIEEQRVNPLVDNLPQNK